MPESSSSGSATSRRRASGVVIPEKARWPGRLAALLLYGLIRLVAATIRYQSPSHSRFFPDEKTRPAIFAVWHNRLALGLILYHREVRRTQPGRRTAAMVSASKDGGLLTCILEHFGVQPVRGSSSRRGSQALLELTSWANQGLDLAITPDGPRGPRYKVQDGVISLAQLTGLPIIPVSYHLSRKIMVKSWDRFQIPMPFCRCTFQVGEPLKVPRESTNEERSTLKAELERRLTAITED